MAREEAIWKKSEGVGVDVEAGRGEKRHQYVATDDKSVVGGGKQLEEAREMEVTYLCRRAAA